MTVPYGPRPVVVGDVRDIDSAALEGIAQWLEGRGIRVPIGSIVGYQQQQLVTLLDQSFNSQSVPDGTETALIFDSVLADKQKLFDGVSTVTLPFNGVYLVTGSISWPANSTGARAHFLKQNGVAKATDWRAAQSATQANADSTLAQFVIGVKGDHVTHSVFHDAGVALTLVRGTLGLTLITPYG